MPDTCTTNSNIIKEYIDAGDAHTIQLLTALEKLTEIKFNAADKALRLSAVSLDKRLERMNEFRSQLRDQQSTFVTRNEYSIAHDRLREDVKALEISKATLDGKASQSAVNTSLGIGIIGVIAGMVSIILRLMGV